MKNIRVSDVMTRYPVTISPEANLLECTNMMVKKKVGSLLITKEKKLVGFISQKDILWALIKTRGDLTKIKVMDISSKKIATIKPEATIKEALQKMKNLKFEKLPVIKNNELVGIVTVKDILNFNPEIYPELDELAEIREETEKLKRIKGIKTKSSLDEGICEECGSQDFLYRFNGMLVCESCKGSM